jgi:hypothetical protein
MKTQDDLKPKLAAWSVKPEFRRDFNRDVWKRIAAEQAHQSEGIWATFYEMIFASHRLAPVASVALLLLTASVGAAHFTARSANEKHWLMLEDRYARSINPITRSSDK